MSPGHSGLLSSRELNFAKGERVMVAHYLSFLRGRRLALDMTRLVSNKPFRTKAFKAFVDTSSSRTAKMPV